MGGAFGKLDEVCWYVGVLIPRFITLAFDEAMTG